MDSSETRYADTPLGEIAYQAIGTGPLDVLVEAGLNVPVDALWDEPRLIRYLERLSGFCRHIWFDTRGRGASDPMPEEGSRFAESVTDDMVALLDALDIERVAVLSLGLGSLSGQFFAAWHPERTRAVVLRYPSARQRRGPDYPEGVSEATLERLNPKDFWGTERSARWAAPSVGDDDRFLRWLARCQRACCSPAVFRRRNAIYQALDARGVLPSIGAPALVITRPGGRAPQRMSHYVAEHIPGAREVVLPGDPLFFTGDTTPMLDAIEEFLTGNLPTPVVDRVLATILFTDIVDSTAKAVTMGDRRWRALLDDHHRLARQEVERHRGRVVKTTGDGVLATFDGPGRAILAARAIGTAVRPLGVEVRAGLHTGEVELMGEDVGGIAVHTAARVQAIAGPGEVLVSRTLVDLVAGSGIEFTERGPYELKGVPGTWQLFSVQA